VKAAYLTGIRQVEIREAPRPEVSGPRDVLLRMDTVGVCGSDMHYFRTGRIGDQVVQFPWVLGHECAATVAEAGAEAGPLKAGDRVAVDPLIWCGRCDQCRSGREHTCRNQKFLGCPGQVAGCLADYIVMPAASCHPVPASLDAASTVLAEPMSIALWAQRLAGDLAGARIAILGAGPIGLCVLLACRDAGAAAVYMTDIRDSRAELAANMGADWTGNPEREDIVAAVLAGEPLGLDAVFECAGEQSTLDEALALVRPGGRIMLVGIPELDRVSFEIATLRRHEVTVQPVRRQNHCVGETIEMIAAGRLDVKPMVTHDYTLEQTQGAFETVADYRDNVVKAMIHLA
jgi:L-iditol 2-dehydrogenase